MSDSRKEEGFSPSQDHASDTGFALDGDKPDATPWLKSGEYLPEFLRDHHDAKDFFKALDEVSERSKANGNRYIDGVSWMAAQVFTIDIFLWMAARNGYTLQRSRKRVHFNDVGDFVGSAKRRREAEYRKMWDARPPADGASCASTNEAGPGSGTNNPSESPNP